MLAVAALISSSSLRLASSHALGPLSMYFQRVMAPEKKRRTRIEASAPWTRSHPVRVFAYLFSDQVFCPEKHLAHRWQNSEVAPEEQFVIVPVVECKHHV